MIHAHVEYVALKSWDQDWPDREFWTADGPAADLNTALERYPARARSRPASWVSDQSYLMFALARAGRWAELAERFEATGHLVHEIPWDYGIGGPDFLTCVHRRAMRARPRPTR